MDGGLKVAARPPGHDITSVNDDRAGGVGDVLPLVGPVFADLEAGNGLQGYQSTARVIFNGS